MDLTHGHYYKNDFKKIYINNVDVPEIENSNWKLLFDLGLLTLVLLHYLLPKCQWAIKVQHYISIHLFNVSFKIFTKVTNLQ